jgi:hypothetical protein
MKKKLKKSLVLVVLAMQVAPAQAGKLKDVSARVAVADAKLHQVQLELTAAHAERAAADAKIQKASQKVLYLNPELVMAKEGQKKAAATAVQSLWRGYQVRKPILAEKRRFDAWWAAKVAENAEKNAALVAIGKKPIYITIRGIKPKLPVISPWTE